MVPYLPAPEFNDSFQSVYWQRNPLIPDKKIYIHVCKAIHLFISCWFTSISFVFFVVFSLLQISVSSSSETILLPTSKSKFSSDFQSDFGKE